MPMLAPIDKLLSNKNRIIQIVITRNCDIFNCSNCTQLLPFRKDAREMSLECVEEALNSVKDWPGTVACFGGNPCTHSQFPEVCRLWQRIIPHQNNRGLWTNDLRGHGAIAKETFWPHGVFNLNVHTNRAAEKEFNAWLPGVKVWGTSQINHGGMLLDYRDYGYTDDQWIAMRNKCPINQNWSAGIYPRDDETGKQRPYVYGCEVMGSLDGVRGQNNGILATPGWWHNHWDYFAKQEHVCVGCGVPLNTKGHVDTDNTYDVSPEWAIPTMKRAGQVTVQIHSLKEPPKTHELTDYVGLRLKPST